MQVFPIILYFVFTYSHYMLNHDKGILGTDYWFLFLAPDSMPSLRHSLNSLFFT